ncbi:MAG: hypothetical protein K0R39_3627 [Symbiobacteriaceae bacterium]|nr:hypothetical protein [Symbiobacteriaceae bacterium]
MFGKGLGVPERVNKAWVLLTDEREKLVLLLYRGGAWNLPGGTRQANETLAQAAVRSVLADTGLTVEIGDILCVHRTSETHELCVTFRGRIRPGKIKNAPDGNAQGVHWQSLHRAGDLLRWQADLAVLLGHQPPARLSQNLWHRLSGAVVRSLGYLSVTAALAKMLKNRLNPTKVILCLNLLYFGLSCLLVATFCAIGWRHQDLKTSLPGLQVQALSTIWAGLRVLNLRPLLEGWLFWSVALITWSRVYEIFYAFVKDATEKIGRRPISFSELTYQERVKLALRSYAELILGFGLFYWVTPATWWKAGPNTLVDALYFSSVTITTVGYGDITPGAWGLKLLTMFQTLSGMVLLAVSFTVYVSHGLQEDVMARQARYPRGPGA